MTCARAILAAYSALAPWLAPDTVDRVICGDPEKPIRKLLVTWQADETAIEYARVRGFDAIVVHEPTFWFHRDEWDHVVELPDESYKKRAALAKRETLDHAGVVILRIHDAWDAMPEVGIPWAWAQHLGLCSPVATRDRGMQQRYDIEPRTLATLAVQIGQKTALLGDIPPICFGEPQAIVRSVGIGTGCITDLDVFAAMGCDAAVVCDDGCTYWCDVAWALEAGLSVIRVSHGASEEPGMCALTAHLAKLFPACEVVHHPYPLRISQRMDYR